MSGEYDVAQVCPNGHVATSYYNSYAQQRNQYCETCGEKTLVSCPNCEKPIRGSYRSRILAGGSYHRPAFCQYCGNAFPWTASKLQAAEQLARELDELTEDDQKSLQENLEYLVKDTPKTQVAASRVKKLLGKAGEGASSLFKELLTDIISETAKKMIFQ